MKKPKSVLIGMTILCGISVANIGYSFAEEPNDKIVDEYTDIRPYQPNAICRQIPAAYWS